MECKDIVRVLKACQGLNISELEIGDFKVKFTDLTDKTPVFDNSTKIVPFKNQANELQEVEEMPKAEDFYDSLKMGSDPLAYEEDQLRALANDE